MAASLPSCNRAMYRGSSAVERCDDAMNTAFLDSVVGLVDALAWSCSEPTGLALNIGVPPYLSAQRIKGALQRLVRGVC